MNVIALTGNICRDLELTYTKNNKSVLENTLAVNKGIKNEDGTYDVDFINFVCFEKKADYLKNYAKKGNKLEITGKLRSDSWKDDEGKSHYKVYIVADSVKILTSNKEADEKNLRTKTEVQQQFEYTEEELPF